MTTPVDPRPYAAPTDLVTAADVHDWILAWRLQAIEDAKADPSLGAMSVRLDYACVVVAKDIVCDLRARLDRERRQACRRGALAEWREFRRWVHGWGYGWGDGDGIALDVLARALAFRAAARQP